MGHDFDALRAYGALIQPILRLSDWDITFEAIEEADELVTARIDLIDGYYNVTIEIAERFWDEDIDQARVLIHELMHIHVSKLARHFKHIEDHVNMPAYHLFMEAVNIDKEELTDGLARMIVPFLPPLRRLT